MIEGALGGRFLNVSSLKRLLSSLSECFHGETICKTASKLWESDRWFNFSNFSKTADYCAEGLKAAGLEVEVLEVPADGKIMFGDWVMPKAWDADDAVLMLMEPKEYQRILAKYSETPQCLFMYSAPTAEEGVEAEVIYVKDADKPESYSGLEIKGKVVLTEKPGASVEQHAADHGALGIISFKNAGHGVTAPPDSVAWENACFLPDNKKGLFGFSLSPIEGLWLKNLVSNLAAKGLKAKVKAVVKTHLYDGSFKVVSALIPGVTDEEVWALGHLYEPGANDNASGCAVMMEVAEGVQRLLGQGKLPKPKRGLRFIFTFECYGTMAYMLRHKGVEAKVVAGINPDMVGSNQEESKSVLMICENPHVTFSFTDALALKLMEELFGEKAYPTRWRSSGFMLDDNLIADPCFGIPTPALIGLPDRFWHSSKDTPKILDSGLLTKVSCLIAAYMLLIAQASLEDALWLLEETYRLVETKILKEAGHVVTALNSLKENDGEDLVESLSEPLRELQNKLLYWEEVGQRALETVQRLVSSKDKAALLKEAVDAAKNRLRRRIREQREVITNHVERILRAKGLVFGTLEKPEPEKNERLAASIVPKRLVVGTLTFKGLPENLKRKSKWNPAYSAPLNLLLFWIDGKRSLLEIHNCLRSEIGMFSLEELLDYFQFLEMAGYVKLKKKT